MKKIGWYLMSAVPFLVMLTVQLIVSMIAMVNYALVAGDYDAGIALYMDRSISVIMWMHLFTLLVTGTWYYFYVVRRQKKAGQPLAGLFRKKSFGYTVMLAFGAQFLIGILLSVWQVAAPEMIEAYNQLMEESGIATMSFASVLASVILAPVGEEIVFRGLTLEYLKKTGAGFWVINVIQALLFGLAHMNLVQGTYAFLLGLTCGYVVLRYRTLLAGIAVHLVFNAYGTFAEPLLTMLFGEEPSMLVTAVSYLVHAVFGVLLFAAGLKRIRRELEEPEYL